MVIFKRGEIMKRTSFLLMSVILCTHIFLYQCRFEPEITQLNTCTESEVQTAIDAALPGDVIALPAGSATWSTQLYLNKGITIKGAGVNDTVITGGGFWVDVREREKFRISGMSFNSGLISINGQCQEFRIDHCKFSYTGSWTNAVHVRDYAYGVIDHSEFINCRVLVMIMVGSEESWERPLSLGSGEAVFVEDCVFYTDLSNPSPAIDANGGARYVFRHNMVTNGYCLAHGLQNEGMRGTFSYEIYENDFYTAANAATNYTAIFLKSGTGVVYNNNVHNGEGDPYNTVGILQNDRSCDYLSQNWGPCDGSNPVDGNIPGQAGYPCKDQIGRSYENEFYPILYAWNNRMDGLLGRIEVSNLCALNQDHIREKRDFWNDVKRPGYNEIHTKGSGRYPHPLVSNSAIP
jgi:hypothetical protein